MGTSASVLDRMPATIAELRVVGSRPSGSSDPSMRSEINNRPPVVGGIWTSDFGALTVTTGTAVQAFEDLLAALPTTQLWVLFDEWSSMPSDLQPLLAEALRGTLMPVSGLVLKLAATRQRTRLTSDDRGAQRVGIELGADVTVIDLDDALAFHGDMGAAEAFVREVLYRHVSVSLGASSTSVASALAFEANSFQAGALRELAVAGQGVPRDVLNIARTAALRASDRRISVEDVRESARDNYRVDKASAIRAGLESEPLLRWIFSEVLGRRARGFLVEQDRKSQVIGELEDARILHVIRRGVHVLDRPDKRFDVYELDYGTYVDLLADSNQAPLGLFRAAPGADNADIWIEEPSASYESVDEALLDPRLTPAVMDAFETMVDADLPEEEYQQFLAAHPVFLDPLAAEVVPKQRLGIEHITDYAVRRHDGRWILVEIEKPQDPVVTRANDLASQFNHAFGQILDFQRWVDAHGEYARELMPGIVAPRGLLIIGRRSALTTEAQDKLRRYVLNSATIDVLTFDDVAANARNLYRNTQGGG